MLRHQDGRTLTIWAPAKVNLFLEVLGKRIDGYHELETLMISVSLYDTLRFVEEPSGKIHLRCHDAGLLRRSRFEAESSIPEGRNNLVVQAAELLRSETGTNSGVQIELWKRIPVAAGLAGGSSDAAATLVGLNHFWDLGLSPEQLHALACRLGSDVAFFVSSATAAICRGRGEIVEPLTVPLRLHLIIVRPPTGLSTAAVFQHCTSEGPRRSIHELADCIKSGNLGHAAKFLYNRLQRPAELLNQDVMRLKDTFSQLPVIGHMMTGSGSSYFGICAHKRHALAVSARLQAMRIGHVFAVQSCL